MIILRSFHPVPIIHFFSLVSNIVAVGPHSPWCYSVHRWKVERYPSAFSNFKSPFYRKIVRKIPKCLKDLPTHGRNYVSWGSTGFTAWLCFSSEASGLCRESWARDLSLIKAFPPAPSLHAALPNKKWELKDCRDGFWSKVRLWTLWHSEWNTGILAQDLLWCFDLNIAIFKSVVRLYLSMRNILL